tara:strand:- start:436 stop:537 length:102 start_codon:yes stop_codon:yes gene_type:complete
MNFSLDQNYFAHKKYISYMKSIAKTIYYNIKNE